MVKIREDRRVRITKLAIKEAFIELMSTYPLAKISVKMICESADINRSTFYAHYRDHYDLVHQIQQETIDDLREYIAGTTFTKDSQTTVTALTRVLEYARDNTEVFKVLLRDNEDMHFMNDLLMIANEQAMKETRYDKEIDLQTAKCLQHFAINGFMSIIITWLGDKTPTNPSN